MVTGAFSGPREGPVAATSTRGRLGEASVSWYPCFAFSSSTFLVSCSRPLCCLRCAAMRSLICS